MVDFTCVDDAAARHALDKQRMLETVMAFPDHIPDALRCADEALDRSRAFAALEKRTFSHIVISGLGGSAIGGDLLAAWLRDTCPIPITVSRDYTLPACVNKNTLVIAASYSGNTEETLSSFVDAREKKAAVIGISSGGHLETFCAQTKKTHILIKSGMQPRESTAYLLVPMIAILSRLGIARTKKALNETVAHLRSFMPTLAPEISVRKNEAKRVAEALSEMTPVVYGAGILEPVAKRWRTQFNENSKIVGWNGAFPEMNHNETVGWSRDDAAARFAVVFLRDRDDTQAIATRMNFTKKMIAQRGTKTIDVVTQGPNTLAKMMHAMVIGDVASVYLALLRGIDPTPVDVIAKLKKTVGKHNLVGALEAHLDG